MRKYAIVVLAIAGSVFALSVGTYALAGPDDGGQFTRMESYLEVPSISSTAQGDFRTRIDERDQTIHYRLEWTGMEVSATQAHIHLGQRSANGGISVFLCTNLGNAPPSPPNPPTQACPIGPSGAIEGVITPAHVSGPLAQGIEPLSFAELVAAMREGFTYVNIHSARFPGGETRGQIGGNRSDNTGADAHGP